MTTNVHCARCNSSNVALFRGKKQRYLCNECGHRGTVVPGSGDTRTVRKP